MEDGRTDAATSTLTLIEILVQPYRLKKEELVLKFYSLFTTYPHLKWVQLTLGISDMAAKLRAEHNLKTPDAIHMASAISCGATGFVCNDNAFRRVKDTDRFNKRPGSIKACSPLNATRLCSLHRLRAGQAPGILSRICRSLCRVQGPPSAAAR